MFILFCLDLTFFFKTPAGTECHLINCAYNSWKPSQCFPAWSIFLGPIPSTSPSLIHRCPPSPLSLPPSSNQLNQTAESTSRPSGLFCPTLSCPCYLFRGQTLCSLPDSLGNKHGEEKVPGGETGDEAEGSKESGWADQCRAMMRFPAAWISRCCWYRVDSNTLLSHC